MDTFARLERFLFYQGEGFVELNPRLSHEEQSRLASLVESPICPAKHLWIATSGSTVAAHDGVKLVGLSAEALLSSADAVNRHLAAYSHDIWLNVLPHFHVGGLGVYIRAKHAGSKYFDMWSPQYKWNAYGFAQALRDWKITLTSLVPTQVYDLVVAKIQAPSQLRALVVGGGHLSEELYFKARELGWPLLPSFGMTEAASQIATAEVSSLEQNVYPKLRMLSGYQVESREGRLFLNSNSLFTGYLLWKNGEPCFVDPKQEGWFLTEDLVEIQGEYLRPQGRLSDIVKVGGENINLTKLRAILQELAENHEMQHAVALAATQDERLGAKLVMFVEKNKAHSAEPLAFDYNQLVLPYEQIRELCFVDKIPRSDLGKILYSQLAAQGLKAH